MKANDGKISLTIDNKKYQVPAEITILQAAEMNDIYIPTLCAHKDLTPYGGCRMCLVEVEGARRFLTACTTPVEQGMIVRTHTDQIQKERREIMELILSEHTSSCLICDEQEGCRQAMPTIRKAGVTTGCRYCPNDDQCELEEVVSYLGIKEIPHPIFYRGLHVEKEDPFYDRDYNLCIYCGRCVRVCQEVRLADVLAFNQRGRNTVIGPAFGRTHVEAGCEFCGSCVSVCPTGSLAEKYNKWEGVPEFQKQTTCALCGVGCQLEAKVKRDKVIGTVPAEKGIVNQGELCVKGRFSVAELVNHHQRLTSPTVFEEGIQLKVSTEEALQRAAEALRNCAPDEFAMLVSPNCTTEDLYVAQKFTRVALGSANIDCSTRWFYGNNFQAYLDLFARSAPLESLKKSSVILSLGLDLQYGRSVVGFFIRRALQQGSKVITIHPDDHSLALTAELWLQNNCGEEAAILNKMIKEIQKEKSTAKDAQIADAVNLLKKAKNPVILVGSAFLQQAHGDKIFNAIRRLADELDAGILPLPAQNNLVGSLLAGGYPELLPGGVPAEDENHRQKLAKLWDTNLPAIQTKWNASKLFSGKKLKVLYLVGETLPVDRAVADIIIYQNIYPLPNHEPDVSFPATAFTETAGSFINGEGRIQRTQQIVSPPGKAMPDWKILSLLAREMGAKGFEFKKISDIQKEMGQIIPEFALGLKNNKKLLRLPENIRMKTTKTISKKKKQEAGAGEFILTETANENIYRGIPLSEKVAGLRALIHEDAAILNPQDAAQLGVQQGEQVKISSNGDARVFPVHISKNQKEKTLQIIHSNIMFDFSDPQHVTLEKAHV
ncbi:MAG: molybdopterin-dependent oxidoreductase [Calditrichaeota bacterium]|nr:molybdopterin-dependent oxidoreductase [Calditrichota bacterium]